MIKICIADDHPVVREGLKRIIEEQVDMEVVDEASTCEEILEEIEHKKWDVLLLDLTMPVRGGLDLIKELRKDGYNIPILVISITPEEQYGLRSMKAGASGYLTKDSAPEKLIDAIRTVATGSIYVSPQLNEWMKDKNFANIEKLPHEELSDREYQVFRMIAQGKTISKIADELSLSVKTISTYRARILEKMHMKTNAEVTFYAIQNLLVDLRTPMNN